ncbi:MAG: fatty acid desaturase [Planctomycetota bacterium]|jgi:fatty acid desaturase
MNQSDEFKLPREVVKNLTLRSDVKGLVQLAAHIALLVVAAALLQASFASIWLLPALVIYGIILIFLFAPLHETIHFTAFRSRWINNLVASVCGFLLLLPYQYFRAFHYSHHRHTQNPELDPELEEKKWSTRGGYWCYLSGLPTWWAAAKTIIEHAQGRVSAQYIEASKHPVIIKEARIHVAGYAALLFFSLLFSSAIIWWYWLLPALLGQPFLRLFLLAEHSGCDLGDNMLENSRTTYTTPMLNLLAWNMPYHAEHHYLASIPFHALPALHAYTGEKVKFRANGYIETNLKISP